MRYNKFINNKINPYILNKFFFLNDVPKINKLFINVSNFKDNDKIVIATLMEEIFCVKPIIKDGGFSYDKTGSKVFFEYLNLTIIDKDLIFNFLLYFYIVTKNAKNRSLFFRGITEDTFIGIMSTFDIQFYFFRDMFSFVAFNFPFIIELETKGNNKTNVLINYHFFKIFGII